jgi:hypothetical protein
LEACIHDDDDALSCISLKACEEIYRKLHPLIYQHAGGAAITFFYET